MVMETGCSMRSSSRLRSVALTPPMARKVLIYDLLLKYPVASRPGASRVSTPSTLPRPTKR